MARTLVVLGLVSVLAMLATAGMGFFTTHAPSGEEGEVVRIEIRTDLRGNPRRIEHRDAGPFVPMRRHITMALLTSVLVLFTQSMVMFYFLGTGARVKKGFRQGSIPESAWRTSRSFHRRVFPLATLATLATMALVILGGGVHTRVLSPWTHWVLFLLAIPLNIAAVWRETLCMAENEALLNSLDAVLPDA